ncbi:response regulator transcription factor [bacterium]|jgi:DNA-binding response OmpR family regulator|nr:response regulator transcription factor [bacterium]
MKILYIHEDSSKNSLATLFFSQVGHECQCATSLLEAREFEPSNFELILLDVPLQFLDSKKELKRLRSLASSSVPIVCLYETTDRNQFERLNSAGVTDFFPATKSMEDLLRYVKTLKPQK